MTMPKGSSRLLCAECHPGETKPKSTVRWRRKVEIVILAMTTSLIVQAVSYRERWLSGRKQRFAKPSYWQNRYRGFESPPLRQIQHWPRTDHHQPLVSLP